MPDSSIEADSPKFKAIVLNKALQLFSARSGIKRCQMFNFFKPDVITGAMDYRVRFRRWPPVVLEKIYFRIALWHQDNNLPLQSPRIFLELRPTSGLPCHHPECE